MFYVGVLDNEHLSTFLSLIIYTGWMLTELNGEVEDIYSFTCDMTSTATMMIWSSSWCSTTTSPSASRHTRRKCEPTT